MPYTTTSQRLRRLALGLGVVLNIGVRISAKGQSGEGGDASWIEGSLRIPRERNLSLQDYYEKYEDAQTPVIIEDYAAAFAGMSEANIKAVCGSKVASVARRVDDKEGSWANIEWFHSGSLEKTWEDIRTESKKAKFDDFEPVEGTLLGLFDWSLQKACPEVLEKHFVVPKYLAQDYLQRVPHHIDVNYRDVWPSLFIAIDGGYGGTHRDVFGSGFWMYVMEGAKEWVIVDSTEGLNFFGSDKPRVRQYHDVVQKGQLLIIPGNRWHQVRNRGNTVTLAGNFIGRGSFDLMKQEVEGDNPSSYYKQLQDTLLAPGFDTSIDYDQDDMTWEEFRTVETSAIFHKLEEETFSVLVTGAGSPEVNGCYKFNGENEGAWQFVRTSAGRTFEIFKVEDDVGWWNILEKVGEEYPNPVHYGVEGDIDSVLPQGDDWGIYHIHWLGMDPAPKVEVFTEKTCLSWTETDGAAIPVKDSWGKIVSNTAVPPVISRGDGFGSSEL
mmetsp:Transcript_22013/g.53273  ORF Transcript_22013/g.53273 Transcript_22013/m.53273 type:complete len:495 (-) Transcript_22013:80-1564(-)|eukprot:CAMPEP_0181113326 /NCGR_PEP_ID=MMETSP1071-20121207/20287_1 /TAXON_ID=35127 /ORGANISM="Thalassiosira sp., Strain NH16" /LENGTH=494 /DNA_ID=CAMNT_0023197355 /DNA_START=102 /DNA_END=1586 /DNA_ORIENTATION=-